MSNINTGLNFTTGGAEATVASLRSMEKGVKSLGNAANKTASQTSTFGLLKSASVIGGIKKVAQMGGQALSKMFDIADSAGKGETVWGGFSQKGLSSTRQLGALIDNAKSRMLAFGMDIIAKVLPQIQKIYEVLKFAFGTAFDWITMTWQNSVDIMGSLFGWLVEPVKLVVVGIIKSISSIVDAIKGALNWLGVLDSDKEIKRKVMLENGNELPDPKDKYATQRVLNNREVNGSNFVERAVQRGSDFSSDTKSRWEEMKSGLSDIRNGKYGIKDPAKLKETTEQKGATLAVAGTQEAASLMAKIMGNKDDKSVRLQQQQVTYLGQLVAQGSKAKPLQVSEVAI